MVDYAYLPLKLGDVLHYVPYDTIRLENIHFE